MWKPLFWFVLNNIYLYIIIYLHIYTYIYTVYIYMYVLSFYVYTQIYIYIYAVYIYIYLYFAPFSLDVLSLGHFCFTLLCSELRSPTGRFRSPRLGHQPTEPSSNGATYWYRVINHIDIWIYIFINQYFLPIHLQIVHHFSMFPLVNKHRPWKSPIFNGN